MSLVYRFKRLVKSDLHALVEGMEEKKWVLAQAIRDMEEELEKMKQAIETRKAQHSKLSDAIRSNEVLLKKTEGDIDFAMKEKREEIAKNLLKKLLLTKQNQERFEKELAQISKEIEKLEADYQNKKQSYEEVCTRSEGLHLERVGDDLFSSASKLIPEDSSLNHQVEIEFLKRLQKVKEASHEN